MVALLSDIIKRRRAANAAGTVTEEDTTDALQVRPRAQMTHVHLTHVLHTATRAPSVK